MSIDGLCKFVVESLVHLVLFLDHDWPSVRVALPRRDENADVASASTATDREEVQRLRRQCENSMVFAAKMLSNRHLYRINMIIRDLLAPIHKRYAQQNLTNR